MDEKTFENLITKMHEIIKMRREFEAKDQPEEKKPEPTYEEECYDILLSIKTQLEEIAECMSEDEGVAFYKLGKLHGYVLSKLE